jgi:hypothetical protein
LALAGRRGGARTGDRLDTVLEKQSRMLDLQIETLEEDRAIERRHLALSHSHLVLSHFGDRLRIGLMLVAIAFGLIGAGGGGSARLVWSGRVYAGASRTFRPPSARRQQRTLGP